MIIEKDIARISVGSQVVEIVKQRGSRKIAQKGWVRDLHTIEKLIEMGVERVLVDTSKRLDESNETPDNNAQDKNQNKSSDPAISDIPEINEQSKTEKVIPTKKPIISTSFAESIREAKSIFDESKNLQKKR